MEQGELKYWQSVTESSKDKWVEDHITRLNGQGLLYYIGGENGHYMRLYPDGKLSIGVYEGAYPHIGEAAFKSKATHQYTDLNQAFEAVCNIGGVKFMCDLFSGTFTPPPDRQR